MAVTVWDEDIRQHAAVVFGVVEKIGARGDVWVNVPGHGTARASVLRSVEGDSLRDALKNGSPIAMLPAGEGCVRPVIVGVVADRITPETPAESDNIDARVDGRNIVLTGKEQVTLRCGKSSITLTKAGKVLLRGAYVLSRSSGVNRIKGGSVQIN